MKELEQGATYNRIILSQIILGFACLFIRFLPDANYINSDLCDRDAYDDQELNKQRLLCSYIGILIFLHFIQWISYITIQRKNSAILEFNTENQCRVWGPVIILFIVISVLQAVIVYFVISNVECEPFLRSYVILDTFINILGSFYLLIDEPFTFCRE